MRHWLVLGAIYALAAALVLPTSLFASEDAAPAAAPAAPAEQPSVAAEQPGPEAQAPPLAAEAQVAPAGDPAPAAPETAPGAPGREPAAAQGSATGETPAEANGVQDLGDERDRPGEQTERLLVKAAATSNVVITDFEFTPATITVIQGDTVVWTNDGPAAHSATASDGSFDTGIFPSGESREVTFDDPGRFAYICTPHPNMKGTVVVEAADSDPAGQEEEAAVENAEEVEDQALAEDTLPATGGEVQALILLGLLMLALGAVIEFRARRQS